MMRIYKNNVSMVQISLPGVDSGRFSATFPPPIMDVYQNDDENILSVQLHEIDSITFTTLSGGLFIPGNGVTDIDGNFYPSVIIGTQEWTTANLRTSRYANGTAISSATTITAWQAPGTTSGRWCHYEYNAEYDAVYGKLYNWFAAAHGGICPTGWHVPTDAEWTVLTDYLGGASVAGGKMKATTGWNWNNFHDRSGNGTNESDFTGLPGGSCSSPGDFGGMGNRGGWWSSSDYQPAPNAPYLGVSRSLDYLYSSVDDDYLPKSDGYSIRCIRN